MKKIISTVIILAMPLAAMAGRYNHNVAYGNVVEVEPIYQTVSVPERHQVCDRHVRSDRHGHRNGKHNHAGAIIGGIIGGAIGNRFGKGRGRDASTALGVLVGASVGAHKNGRNHHRCHNEVFYRDEQRFMGYDVTYEYNGELYYTQMQDHPGERVRLSVNVNVID